MTRQSELKKIYNPDTGKYTRQHIWSGERSILGEGIFDKVFGKKTKKKVKFTPPPPPKKTYLPKKAGDKIVKMLSSTKPPKMTNQEINNIVLQIMSGGIIAPQGRKII